MFNRDILEYLAEWRLKKARKPLVLRGARQVGKTSEQDLYYWAREKSNTLAEVDFCVVSEGKIIGIEVKSGHAGKLKSLLSFAKNVEDGKIVRIYNGPLREEVIAVSGTKYKLNSLPFYLVNRVFELC